MIFPCQDVVWEEIPSGISLRIYSPLEYLSSKGVFPINLSFKNILAVGVESTLRPAVAPDLSFNNLYPPKPITAKNMITIKIAFLFII